jgi:hypothetical protein
MGAFGSNRLYPVNLEDFQCAENVLKIPDYPLHHAGDRVPNGHTAQSFEYSHDEAVC